MDFSQLEHFVALAENDNLTQVAHNLGISPSSLSRTITKLESELRVQMFDRVNRKIILNSRGRIFLDYARNALSELERGISLLQRTEVISFVTDAPDIWEPILNEFFTAYPHIQFSRRILRTENITAQMLLEDYDFYLAGHTPQLPTEELNCYSLCSDTLHLAVPADGPLANRESVFLGELRDQTFIFPTSGYPHHNLCVKLCKNAGFTPKIFSESSYLVRMKLISSGKGISFTDSASREHDLFKNVAFVPIANVPKLQPIALYWHKDRILKPSATSFWENITMYC